MSRKRNDPNEIANATEFPNARRVAIWLEMHGYKVTERSIARHAEVGKLRADLPNRGFSIQAVREYAAAYLTKRQEIASDEQESLAVQKQKVDIALKKEACQLTSLKRQKTEGSLIARRMVESELAGRALVMDFGLKHLALSKADDMIAAVEGNHARAQALIKFLQAAFDELLASYCEPVVFDFAEE